MRNTIFLLAILATLSGCSLLRGPDAVINDVAVPEPLGSGYRIKEVDGKPAERVSSDASTEIPCVYVEPGQHTFVLEPAIDKTLPPAEVTATLESGRHYRLTQQGKGFAIVAEGD